MEQNKKGTCEIPRLIKNGINFTVNNQPTIGNALIIIQTGLISVSVTVLQGCTCMAEQTNRRDDIFQGTAILQHFLVYVSTRIA